MWKHAGLSYQVLTEKKDECKVLAAVMPGPVLAEYEAAVRAAGYEPGAVLPSGLAVLEAGEAGEALKLCWSRSERAVADHVDHNGQDLLLYRTLDLPQDAEMRSQEVRRGIAVAAAYYEDKLGSRPPRLYLAHHYGAGSDGELEEFARWMDDPELTLLELAPRPETGAVTSLGGASVAGVTGALGFRGSQTREGQARKDGRGHDNARSD